ncbi:MAG: rod-binding protein [Acidobacteriota bacterium]
MSDSLNPIALHPIVRDAFPVTSEAGGLPITRKAAGTTTLNRVTPGGIVAPASSDPAKPQDSAGAAREFEALLIGQMLRSAHQSGDQDDPTSDTMWDMAAQQFSRVLATNGGLGLARIITQGLPVAANHSDKPADKPADKPVTP